MTEDDQESAQRTANLARIRDNQRRSRARRKEYLQELESKYRSCEQVGVEASAEIQAAARKVLDENRRLRHMLKQQGLSDGEIDGTSEGKLENPQYPSAARTLEAMIGQRKPCGSGEVCGRSGTGSLTPPQERRASQIPLAAKIEPASVPPPQMAHLQPAPSQQQQQQQHQPRQQQPPPPHGQPLRLTPQHNMLPNGQPYAPSPHSSSSSGIPTPNNTHFPPPPPMNGYHLPQGAPPQPPADYNMDFNDTMTWDGQYPHFQLPQQGDSSSCYAAAGAIRTFKPDLGYELETELGCGDGRDCNVPNSRIFSIMDRYSDGG